MNMTRERLEEYRSKKEEIIEVQCKLDNLGLGDSMIGNDVIFDYSKGFPRPQAVVGYDYEKHEKLRTRYEKRLHELSTECAEIELWIEEIPDSMTRRIFRMYYIDNMTQQVISKKIHLSQSKISEKISTYLQVG